jgi:hypothetical protein
MNENQNAVPAPVIGPDGSVNVLIPFDAADGSRTWKVYRSTDGTAWSATGIEVPMGNDPYWSGTGPSLAIAPDGTIAVLYTDHGADQGQPGCPSSPCTTDVWLKYSSDGKSWHTLHLGGPFDIEQIPGAWVGEFVDLRAMENGVGAVFALGACEASAGPDCTGAKEGRTDIFFARIAI